MVRLLLAHGACVRACSDDGRSALDYARMQLKALKRPRLRLERGQDGLVCPVGGALSKEAMEETVRLLLEDGTSSLRSIDPAGRGRSLATWLCCCPTWLQARKESAKRLSRPRRQPAAQTPSKNLPKPSKTMHKPCKNHAKAFKRLGQSPFKRLRPPCGSVSSSTECPQRAPSAYPGGSSNALGSEVRCGALKRQQPISSKV